MKSKLKKLMPIIGITILIYLIIKIGINNIIDAISDANPKFIIFALFLNIPIQIIHAYKWNIILKKQKLILPFKEILIIHLKGVFYGIITPGRFGSIVRGYYVGKKLKEPIEKGIVSALIDKILDLLCIFILASIGAIILYSYFPELSMLAIGILIIFIFFLFLFFKKERSDFLFKLFSRFLLPEKFKSKARESFDIFYDSMLKPKQLILPFTISLISWIIIYFQVFVVFKALSINIGFIQFLFIISIGTLALLIPISVSGLGTREAILVVLFIPFGVPASLVVGASLTAYFVDGLLPSIFTSYFALRKNSQEQQSLKETLED